MPHGCAEGAVLIFAGKFSCIGLRCRMRRAVVAAFDGDRWDGDIRQRGQFLLVAVVFALAFFQP